MKESILDKIDHYREAFGRAVTDPKDTRAQIATRLEGIATNFQTLGIVIDHGTDLHNSYVAAAMHCQSQIAGKNDYIRARAVLATILTPVTA